MRRLAHDSPADILTALTTSSPSPLQLDGASSLFCSLDWTQAQGRHLPDALSTALTDHIVATGTEPMRFRLRAGYYGATDAT
ncbi:hypothetical protein Stsp02_45190 [Streptomyces sp. NBRC 14336]|uniref:hypothetical protein n=1 Tax=Streptomyces sp. NBRC 14336 TaxID=3030992 RepID=UPI0024A5634B|nr:hypothetical protein [Streptomyces sp. NBRC 14336]GLW48857.1 hypothetical protein Stsp02_45190 [Streptomyces sp. NBRC 14336]